MRAFFDGLDAADEPVPADARCAAALGPKMLDLARERSLGAHSYFVPVAHTRSARERLGPDALLAPEVAFVLEEDAETARRIAREYAAYYLASSNYTNNLLRLGWSDGDIADGGSDALIDALIPHGSAGEVAAAVSAHFEAGADHVCVQALGDSPAEDYVALAREVL
jgi:probable F420-dependent oxidoreductase